MNIIVNSDFHEYKKLISAKCNYKNDIDAVEHNLDLKEDISQVTNFNGRIKKEELVPGS